jgi:hypothetical protein
MGRCREAPKPGACVVTEEDLRALIEAAVHECSRGMGGMLPELV